eukprot:6204456-Pleurochrysis_carterae.AAC.1
MDEFGEGEACVGHLGLTFPTHGRMKRGLENRLESQSEQRAQPRPQTGTESGAKAVSSTSPEASLPSAS